MATKTSLQTHYIDSDMSDVEIVAVAGGSVVAFCRRCPSSDEANDDSAAIVETANGAIVLIVADGVGGGPLGRKASAIAVESLTSGVVDFQSNDLRPAILDAIENANREILDLGVGAATTVSIVEIQDCVARGYQVGDSQTLIIGQRGAIRWKSTSHSPVGYAIESGLLDESDAMHHEERHVVSNLVGSREMHIEIGPAQPLHRRDTVIVGSDGLFDNLHLDEVIALGRIGKPESRMADLAGLATARMDQTDPKELGKPDDLSILMFTLS
jgi:serine/threonine protein phosphatase PrpC